MHIYAIQNIINGKMYIGKTVQNFDKYWKYNIRCAELGKSYKPALYAAIRKYGVENFTARTIYNASNVDDLNCAEISFIKLFGTNNKNLGYNLTLGGDGTVGAERTAEWKANISSGNTGKQWSAERKLAASLQRKGRKLSKEHREKIGQSVRGTKKPAQWVEKLIARNKLKKGLPKLYKRTAEHQAKLVASRLANRQKQQEA